MNKKAPTSASPHPAERPPQPSRARFIIPVVLIGLIVGLLGAVLKSNQPGMTVSEVTRAIRQVALRPSDRTEARQGGKIGPWWLAADECDDPLSGEFVNLRITSGNMLVAARRAKLHVDPLANSIRFEMWDVVFARVPYTKRTEQSEEHFVHQMEHYVLGPAPWGDEIVPDSGDDDAGGVPALVNATKESG